ncbi:MAG: prolyl oligopeptidase family serine peptidase, partial [Planctomycetaceae bacterium]|nr:prolyl oligopeptidase family serine peptidase [Planctomycetaceae bacterium]
LAGTSGGGHMAMLMAGYHPERFSAVSAWVGISDLAAWYQFHVRDGKPQRYAQMVVKSCGGAPGASAKVDQEYKARSPIFHLHQTGDLPIHLYAGRHDGHTGSVPVSHTLNAFNVIAEAGGHEKVSEAEIQQLLNDKPLENPKSGDTDDSPTLGRKTYLQRKAGSARVTIFEGGHEGLPIPGCAWLAMQNRLTKKSSGTPSSN